MKLNSQIFIYCITQFKNLKINLVTHWDQITDKFKLYEIFHLDYQHFLQKKPKNKIPVERFLFSISEIIDKYNKPKIPYNICFYHLQSKLLAIKNINDLEIDQRICKELKIDDKIIKEPICNKLHYYFNQTTVQIQKITEKQFINQIRNHIMFQINKVIPYKQKSSLSLFLNQLNSLQYLCLANMNLKQIDLSKLKWLKNLNLKQNKFSNLDNILIECNQLNSLNLSYNELVEFDAKKMFDQENKLEDLDLSFNLNINIVLFKQLIQLKRLYLENCNLLYFHPIQLNSECNTIENINLNNNLIKEINLSKFESLKELYIENNPIENPEKVKVANPFNTIIHMDKITRFNNIKKDEDVLDEIIDDIDSVFDKLIF